MTRHPAAARGKPRKARRKARGWVRLLWGVSFWSSDLRDPPILLGQAWINAGFPSRYDGEPLQPLTFTSRSKARAWCRSASEKFAYLRDPRWLFKAVRVRQTVLQESVSNRRKP